MKNERIVSRRAEFLNIPAFEDFRQMQEDLVRQAGELKEKVYLQACELALGSPFEIKDAPDFQIGVTPGGNTEILRYKGEVIGTIVFKHGWNGDGLMNNLYTIGWEFRPAQKST